MCFQSIRLVLKVDGPTVKLRLEAEGPESARPKTQRSGQLKQIESGRYEV